MSLEATLQRALTRYADRIYRIALLSDPHPARAAKATATAFNALDWTTIQLDEQLEERIFTALPHPSQRRQRAALPALPADFWRLPATTRTALGLRLTRGYSSNMIAGVLGKTTADVRQELLAALAVPARPDDDEQCKQLRLASLDDPLAGRVHRLTCEACRTTMAHVTEQETMLTIAIEQATAGLHLPGNTEQEIVDAFHARTRPARPRLRHLPLVQIGLLIATVMLITTALIVPRSTQEPLAPAQVPESARDVLATALEQYGAPAPGEGIVYQRFEITTGQPAVTRIADVWTDAATPGRHRMQITVNNVLQEWQAGDGAGALRYLSNGTLQSCGRSYPDSRIRAGQLNRWSMNAVEQAVMRTSRWQYGPWAVGRHYLEQAQAAEQLRSLGVVVEDGQRVVTIAAEGSGIDGTLLLRLDAGDLTLNEVREVTVDQGTTSTLVPWRLANTQQIEPEAAMMSGILSSLPLQPRPREYERPMPILDPACPLWDINHAYSLTSTLKQGTTPVIGLRQVPAGIERIYLAGRRRAGGQADGEDDYLRLIYVGDGKRLTLLALPGLTTVGITAAPPESISTGQWRVRIRSAGIGELRGDARPAIADVQQSPFWFVAEGWTADEVLNLLADAHRLDLADISTQHPVLYEPGPDARTAGAANDIP